jgi:hypothetical protein
MVNEIHKVLDDDAIKHIYAGGHAIPFLKKESFIQKLHQYAQDFQIRLIVVKTFFMPLITHHQDDMEY